MIYASQDPDSEAFVIFLTILVATMNIGMLIWLVVRLLMECVRESQEESADDETNGKVSTMKRIISDLQMSVQRWRDGRMTEEARQNRIRSRTVDSNIGHLHTRKNPVADVEMAEMKWAKPNPMIKTISTDKATGRRFSMNNKTGISVWLDDDDGDKNGDHADDDEWIVREQNGAKFYEHRKSGIWSDHKIKELD